MLVRSDKRDGIRLLWFVLTIRFSPVPAVRQPRIWLCKEEFTVAKKKAKKKTKKKKTAKKRTAKKKTTKKRKTKKKKTTKKKKKKKATRKKK